MRKNPEPNNWWKILVVLSFILALGLSVGMALAALPAASTTGAASYNAPPNMADTVRHLPGPDVLKGVVFMNIENTSFYPAAFLLDRFHAGIRNGELPPLLNKKTFWGQVVRHIAFGVALGLLYKPDKV